MPLPDIDQDSYNQFAADKFAARTAERIKSLAAEHSFVSRTSSLIGALGAPGYEPVDIAHVDSPFVTGGPGVIVPPVRPPAPPQLPTPQLPAYTPPPAQPTPVPAPAPLPPGPAPTAQPQPAVVVSPGAPTSPTQPTAPAPTQPGPGGPIPQIPTIPEIPTIPGSPQVETPAPPVWAPTSPGRTGPAPSLGAQGAIPAAINVPVNSGPSITRQQAEAAVSGTAMEGYGGLVYDLGIKYNIDPAFALSVARNESNYGGTPAQQRNNNIFSISNALYGGQPVAGSRWGQYPSKEAGIEAFYRLISTEYYPNGQTTVGSVMWGPNGSQTHAYAPTAENSTEYPDRLIRTMTGYSGVAPGPAAAVAPTAPVAPVAPARPVATAMNQSQRDTTQLTAAEAEAACGPAAAVRFVQAYGRNPTLREATDLAASVGWTAGSGMAGIQSEQKLLGKLGIDSKLVGRDWDAIATEAQTGNPVIISTPGHYYMADGYNPQTGAFHVGRSGLDLRQGAEWMTAEQMERVMGTAQGALFASNPSVLQPSTATEPTKALQESRTAFKDGLATAPAKPSLPTRQPSVMTSDPEVQRLIDAVEVAHLPRADVREADDATTGPTPFLAGAAPPGPPSGNPFDQFGQTMANALRGLFGGGGPPDNRDRGGLDDLRQQQARDAVQEELERIPAGSGFDPTVPAALPDTALQDTSGTVANRSQAMIDRFRQPLGPEGPDVIGQLGGAYLKPPKDLREAADRAIADISRRGVPSPGPGGQLGILQPGRSFRELNPLTKGPEGSALEDILSAAPRILGGGGGSEEINPLRRVADEARQGPIGDVVGDALRAAGYGEREIDEFASRVGGFDRVAAAIGPPRGRVLPGNVAPAPAGGAARTAMTGARAAPGTTVTATTPAATVTATVGKPPAAISRNRLQSLWDNWVRAYSDRQVDLNHVQEDFARRLGRPMRDDEMVAFLNRVDPGHRALVQTENALGPAIRAVGRKNYGSLQELIEAKTNISIAEALGNRVERDFMAAGIPERLQTNLQRAQDDEQTRQLILSELTRGNASPTAIADARRRFADAQKVVAARQADIAQAVADMPAAARSQRNAQVQGRVFPGGKSYADAQQTLTDLQARHTPDEWNQLSAAAQAVQDFREQQLDELVDAGVMSPAMATELRSQMPFWTPTRYLDFMADNSGSGQRVGQRIGLSDRDLRRYTLEGSAGEAEDHLQSMVGYGDKVARMSAKNRTFNALIEAQGGPGGALKQIAPDEATYRAAAPGTMLPPDYKVKSGKNEQVITGWVNGEKQQWVTDDPFLHAAIEAAPDTPLTGLAGWFGKAGALVRETATQRNPGWLALNTAADASNYLLTTGARGGLRGNLPSLATTLGPAAATAKLTDENDPERAKKIAGAAALGFAVRSTALKGTLGPNVLGEYLRALPDAFAGIQAGRYGGKGTQEYLLGGGGMRGGSFFGGGLKDAAARVSAMRRGNGFELRSMDDLKRWIDTAAFGWVKAAGNRIELVPRVAAMRVAQQRGASKLESVMAGRNVNIDFDRGGSWVRATNRMIPFLNAGVQGGTNVMRLARDNPGGLLAMGTALVGGPAFMIEAHNHSTPELERDYADVPEYVKRTGVVVMLGGEPGVDQNGNRKPNYFVIPLRNFAPFAQAAREAYNRASGREGKSLGDLAKDVLAAEQPLSYTSPADLAFGGLSLPGISTAGQLYLNRDLFRDSTIANQYSDESASALAQAAAPPLTSLLSGLPGQSATRVRPSQIDFALRDVLGGTGNQITGASNIAAGRAPRTTGPSDTPVLGGVLGRFVRNTGGQRIEDATTSEAMLDPSIRRTLRGYGDYYEPSVVPDQIAGIALRQSEKADFQERTNKYFNDLMREYGDAPEMADADFRAVIRQRLMNAARQMAGSEVMANVDPAELLRRYEAGQAPAAGRR